MTQASIVLGEFLSFLGPHRTQVIVGLVVVVVAFILLRAVASLLRFGVVLAIGAAVGIGASYLLTRLGVQSKYAYWTAIGVTLVVLLLGMRRKK
jgi:hypothetical protein